MMKKQSLLTLVMLALTNIFAAVGNAATNKSYYAGTDISASIKTQGYTQQDLDSAVVEGSIPITFENDAKYPWYYKEGAIYNGNRDIFNSTSSLSFKYNSSYNTFITFDWYKCNWSGKHTLEVYVDDVLYKGAIHQSTTEVRIYVKAGNHKITFKDVCNYNYNTNDYSFIKNILVKEIKPLEDVILSQNSEKLTFKNDGEKPWLTEDGYVRNTNYEDNNSTSSFSTTFTIDKPSKFSFDCAIESNRQHNSGYSQDLIFKINGYPYKSYLGNINKETHHVEVLLNPGTYTLEWMNKIQNYNGIYFTTEISNIELSSNCIDVNVSTPGMLGVEVLYKVNVLNDVELLKVSGTLNETDWKDINKMNNLLGLDLTQAKFENVPKDAFKNQRWLSDVKLPEGVKSIGESAFLGTQIYQINIPASVESIGLNAFYETRLRNITFATNSKLNYIGEKAFFRCSKLEEFIMPNTVKKLDYEYNNYANTFRECTSLKRLIYSDSIEYIPIYTNYECSSLEELHLPKLLKKIGQGAFYECDKLRTVKFPDSLDEIEYSAFKYCALDSVILPIRLSYIEDEVFAYNDSLKYVELPSYINNPYLNTFRYCNNINKVVCKSATPPITNKDYDPFGSIKKQAATLIVPSFAMANYKLDEYWYQFGNIVSQDMNLDFWRIDGKLFLLNDRRMSGKPDIEITPNGKLTIDGKKPLTTKIFEMKSSDEGYSCLVNECDFVTADKVTMKKYVKGDCWYFISPTYDIDLSEVKHSADVPFIFRYFSGYNRSVYGSGKSWQNVTDGKLLAGHGYIFQCDENGWIELPAMTGKSSQLFNTQDVTMPLDAYSSSNIANRNWNLIGNPYPCYYDVYRMDFTAPITVWEGNTYKAYSIVDDSYVLKPNQAFFVQRPDDLKNVVFHKEGRQIDPTVNRPAFANTNSEKKIARKLFDINISDENGNIDETRVVLNEEASLDYEINCDASKFMSMIKEMPQIFTTDRHENSYAINERPENNGEITLGYSATVAGYYTISAKRADGNIILVDKKYNTSVSLSEQDYTFHSEGTNGIDNERFVLKLSADGETTDIENAENIENGITAAKDAIIIKSNGNMAYQIFTLEGKLVKAGTTNNYETTVNMPAGNYIVKMNDSVYKVVVL